MFVHQLNFFNSWYTGTVLLTPPLAIVLAFIQWVFLVANRFGQTRLCVFWSNSNNSRSVSMQGLYLISIKFCQRNM